MRLQRRANRVAIDIEFVRPLDIARDIARRDARRDQPIVTGPVLAGLAKPDLDPVFEVDPTAFDVGLPFDWQSSTKRFRVVLMIPAAQQWMFRRHVRYGIRE